MFKKYIVVCLLVFIGLFANAQTGWVKQQFNNKVTIGFPAEIKKASETTYMAKDSIGTVFALVLIDIDKSAYLEATATDTLLTRIKFIDNVVNDIKVKMPKYAIGDVKISQINNTKIYSLTGLNAENQSNVYISIFLAGDTSYSLTCFLPAGANPQNKDIFLKNFVVDK